MNRSQYIAMFRALERTRTRYTECVKITRTDGVQFRFTAHDRELRIRESDGITYTYTPANAFSLTALEVSSGLSVSNMDIDGIIDDDSITELDLQNGMFDHARVDIFVAYWANSRVGILPLRASWIGDLTIEGAKFKADLRGIAQRLAQVFIKGTQLDCRWQLGDANCGVDISVGEGFSSNFTISALHSPNEEFSVPIPTPQHDNFYQWGYVEFLDGDNAGAKMEIYRQYQDRVRLFLPMPRPLVVGGAVRLVAGCNKTFTTCCDKFSNTRRFGGEPFLSGSDLLTRTPDYGGSSDDGDIAGADNV